MSNILPKKSWHVYNDKNREKVKKDETSARIEKERAEERAKAAEKEHRLSLLRSRANVPIVESIKKDEKKLKRFELFAADEGFKDEIKGDYEKNLEVKKLSHKTSAKRLDPIRKVINVEEDHWKHDPIQSKSISSLSKKKSSHGANKDY